VRHPVYVAEAIGTIGMTIGHWSLAAICLAAAQTALQLIRVRYEERVLSDEFPEYAEYAKTTPRFIPKLGFLDLVSAFRGKESGTTAVIVAIALPVLVGATALGIETSVWYGEKRRLQTAADAAAIAAAFQLAASQNDWSIAAGQATAQNGFVAGTHGIMTVNSPPLTGSYAGDPLAAEVILTSKGPPVIAGAFLSEVAFSARAVARSATGTAGSYCALALNKTAADAALLTNNATLPNASCGIASNSTNASGLHLYNNALIAGPVSVAAAAYSKAGQAVVLGTVKYGNPIDDPYAAVSVGSMPACTTQTSSGSNNVTVNLSPGTFCSGMDFKNGAVVNMAPGTYYIKSKLAFQNNATLNAQGGVTIVIVGTYAIGINNNARINVTAPASGPFAGIAILGDRTGSAATVQQFSNNTELNVKGAIYFPSQKVQMDNNATTDPNGCVQLVADRLQFDNNSNFPSNCSGTSVRPIGTPSVLLQE
jgi:hypothetical protein